MTPEQAVSTIKNMIFRPGWTLGARQLSPEFIRVWADVDTVDTSYPDPDGSYRVRKPLRPEALIDVRDLNLSGLCHAILTKLVAPFDTHENREFLQVRSAGGTFRAPLHPHTDDGQQAWYSRTTERAEDMLRELDDLPFLMKA